MSKWKIVKDKDPLRFLVPKHLQILCKIIAKNRKFFIDKLNEVFKINIVLNTYKYRKDLEIKVVLIKDLVRANSRIQRFFNIAAKRTKGEMTDILLIDPNNINKICKIFYIFIIFFL